MRGCDSGGLAMGKTLVSVIVAALTSVAGRLIAGFGVGFVAYKGFDVIQNQFIQYLQSYINSFPAAALQLFYMGGGGVVLNMFFGAFAFTVSLKAVSKLSAGLVRK